MHTAVDDGLGGYLVTAKPIISHKLIALFEEIPEEFREDLGRASQIEFHLSFRAVLDQCEDVFAASRYPFEPDTKISKYPLELLLRCSEFLAKYVANVEPREYIEWR